MWTHIVFLNQSDDSVVQWSPVFVGSRSDCVRVGNEIADYLGFLPTDKLRCLLNQVSGNRFPENKSVFDPIESVEYINDRYDRNRIALLFRDVPENVYVYKNYLDAVEYILKMRDAEK